MASDMFLSSTLRSYGKSNLKFYKIPKPIEKLTMAFYFKGEEQYAKRASSNSAHSGQVVLQLPDTTPKHFFAE